MLPPDIRLMYKMNNFRYVMKITMPSDRVRHSTPHPVNEHISKEEKDLPICRAHR